MPKNVNRLLAGAGHMRRIGGRWRPRAGMGGGPPPSTGPLISFVDDCVHSRGSVATWETSEGVVEDYGIDELIYLPSIGAAGLEGATANRIGNSGAITNWFPEGAPGAAANDAIAPDGTLTADRITYTPTSAHVQTPITQDDINLIFSTWAREVGSSALLRLEQEDHAGGSGTTDIDPGVEAPGPLFIRFKTEVDSTVGANDTMCRLTAFTAGGVDTHLWGAMVQESEILNQLIHTGCCSATKLPDDLECLAGNVPAAMLNSRVKFSFYPNANHDDYPSNVFHILMDYNATVDVDNRISLLFQAGSCNVRVRAAGVNNDFPVTFSRTNKCTIITDPSTGEITLEDFDTGNGTTMIAPWAAWPSGPITFGHDGARDVTTTYFGLLGEPEAA